MTCQFDRRTPEIQRNLRSLYCQATESDVLQGEQWYPAAHRIVCEWAETYGVSIATVACMIAAISPQCEWARNLIIADDILAERLPSIGGIRRNIDKARRILQDRATETLPYFPCGPKVASFAKNLAHDLRYVTVDTHMLQASLNDPKATYTLKWEPYMVFALCFETVARRVQRSPAEFQAIIWHTWKRLYPVGHKRQLRQQWAVMGEY